MSLFPAYSHPSASGSSDTDAGNEAPSEPPKDHSWLSNSSFTPGSSADTKVEKPHKKHKSKRKKKKGDRDERVGKEERNGDCFVVDREGALDPPHPLGRLKCDKSTRERIKRKKTKRKGEVMEGRYFSQSLDNKTGLDKISEEEFVKRTELFNRQLSHEPSNVQLWIQYIQLQDLGGGKERSINEKKLMIVEKAISENPSNETLLNLKLSIAHKILPYDKMVEEVGKVTKRERGKAVGWRWLIELTQWNLSRMTLPSVLNVYSQALNALHSARSQHTIEILFECMMMLRGSGMWELLSRLVETYLDLSSRSALTRPTSLPTNQIRELEEGIVKSGLPLGSLWLRLESVRESVYFKWAEDSEETGRVVTLDDVAPLAFPIALPSHLIPFLLKLPPIPHTQAFYNLIPSNETFSHLDSSEPLLTATLHAGLINMDVGYLKAAEEVLTRPQWIKERLGRKEFFEYVDGVLASIEDEMVQVWRVRWWRWLGETGKLKEAKNLIKSHPNCLPLYVEYALLSSRPLDILFTAIQLNKPPLHQQTSNHLTSLYLAALHLLLSQNFNANREKGLKVAVCLALGSTDIEGLHLSEEIIEKAISNMKHISLEVEEEFDPLEEVRDIGLVLVPLRAVSWLRCHSLLVYLTSGVSPAAALLQSAIDKLNNKLQQRSQSILSLGRVVLEGHYESLVHILHHFTTTNRGHIGPLSQALNSAAKLFPNNIYFIKVHADITMKHGWKGGYSDSLISKLYSVFTLRHRLTSLTDHSSRRRVEMELREVLHESTREGGGGERSGLAWRLLLQYLSTFQADDLKNGFYQAIEHCPSIKSVYLEGGELMPSEVSAIQDILVEKELRLHITTEEIEILREDTPL